MKRLVIVVLAVSLVPTCGVESNPVRLLMGGDVSLARGISSDALQRPQLLFQDMGVITAGADLVMVNLESP